MHQGLNKWNLVNPKLVITGFARPNLQFGVIQAPDSRKPQLIIDAIQATENQSGIIYVGTRAKADELAQILLANDVETVVYHPNEEEPRSIDALVDRTPVTDAMNIAVPQFLITVMNDQIHGIAPQLMDCGVDQIEVAERHGGDLLMRQIQQIAEQDEEWITLLLKG